jgi:hypothetical protein
MRRRISGLVLLLLTAAFPAAAAGSAELVMFARDGCPWCAAWEREVGAVYDRTEEGRRAPLRRVDLDRPMAPELARLGPVFYTPTFVLLACGREVGRIVGYPGEAHFWGLLAEQVARLPGVGAQAC